MYSLSLIFTAKLLIWIFLCRIGSDRQKEQNGKPAIRPSRRVLSIFCPPSPHFTRDRTKPQVEEVLDGPTQAGMSGTEWLLGLDKVKQGYVKLLKLPFKPSGSNAGSSFYYHANWCTFIKPSCKFPRGRAIEGGTITRRAQNDKKNWGSNWQRYNAPYSKGKWIIHLKGLPWILKRIIRYFCSH